ncbi:hypothetical protein Rhopal_000426-T1 [Rhodotorula paludigena]|uniref:Zn(2)-C6 fungal-type domain-containing protein n=1 Tax=Rhodotorula paludigena TaxID=86838 RepID=A0AAV5GDQ7_9BASI|nr:hypothetical protein Rhopal_000426-T1 [Rhodotorula paludigena]
MAPHTRSGGPASLHPRLPAPEPTAPPGAVAERSCRKCRERRVRCSRTVPTCDGCRRLKLVCEFSKPGSWQQAGQRTHLRKEERINRYKSSGTDSPSSSPAPRLTPGQRRDPAPRFAGPRVPLQISPATSAAPDSSDAASEVATTEPFPSSLPPLHLLPSTLPAFPASMPPTAAPNPQLRKARELLTKALTYGVDAAVEKVGIDGFDADNLLFELQACDNAYKSADPASPCILFPLFVASPSSVAHPEGPKAHALLSTYFSRIEPELQLFQPQTKRDLFQSECVSYWMSGVSSPRRGWLASYLSCLALGAMGMTADEWVESGAEGFKDHCGKEWIEEAGRVLLSDGVQAALLILHYHLLGFGPAPDLALVLSGIRMVLSACFELELHLEPDSVERMDERKTLWWRVAELEGGYCESQKFVELLTTVTSLRMHSALLELGQAGGNAGECEWERNAATLLAMHPLDCPQVYHLLAVTAFLHGAIIIALRLRLSSAPLTPSTASALSARLVALVDALQTASWPVVVHQTVQRGVLVLQALQYVSPQPVGWT